MTKEITFTAALPPIQSAVKIPGASDEALRLQLDAYGLDLADLARMRGKKLSISVTVDE